MQETRNNSHYILLQGSTEIEPQLFEFKGSKHYRMFTGPIKWNSEFTYKQGPKIILELEGLPSRPRSQNEPIKFMLKENMNNTQLTFILDIVQKSFMLNTGRGHKHIQIKGEAKDGIRFELN